jgi:hypothetical protein
MRWIVPWTMLGVIVILRRPFLAAKPSHVGIDMDGLACPAPSYGLQPSDEST